MRATMKDIADRLNVSRTTVSLVLNNREDNFISSAVRERILKTAKDMKYSPNRIAQALATGRSRVIGLRADVTRPFYAEALQNLQKVCRNDGYSIMVTEYTNPTEEENISESGIWPVDGMIVFDKVVKTDSSKDLDILPVVSIGALAAGDVDCVTIDLMAGAQEAMYHLIGIGCKRIAFMSPTKADARRHCYTEYMNEAGMNLEYIDFEGETIEDARIFLMAYSDKYGCPDGIFCYNDALALGAYSAILDMGLSMPKDVALMGCDGIRETRYVRPSISTIIMPIEEMCSLAWKMLMNRMNDPSSPRQKVMLKSHLEVRESSCRQKSSFEVVNHECALTERIEEFICNGCNAEC